MGIRIVDSLVGAVAAKTTVCFTRTAGLFDKSKMLTRTRPLVRPTLTTAKSNFPSPFTSRRMSYSFRTRSEEHTSELQSLAYLVCRLLLEKKKKKKNEQRTVNTRQHCNMNIATS